VSRVDLHIHSTASDGRFSPAEVVREAAKRGLSYIALTDHDTVDGIAQAQEAAKSFPGLKVIPGVEISTDTPDGEVHVLGYFIEHNDPEFGNTLEKFKNSRLVRAQGMVAKLENLGIHLDWQRVQEIAGSSSIGRPHIAQAMLEKGYISSFKEAFTDYIGRDRPAYVEREKMTPAEAVAIIIKAGGLAVLAHPLTAGEPEVLTAELKAAGLVGIEAYYDGYSDQEIKRLVGLARKHDLIATGGSDYHGIEPDNETAIGGADVPLESAERLIALAKQRKPSFRL
jgi:predicted metal-dependent phosphoesterase TrpH